MIHRYSKIFGSFLFFLILLIGSSFLFAQENSVTVIRCNFEECVRMALRNNDQIRAAHFDQQEAQGKVLEAHPHSIPVISYEDRVGPAPRNLNAAADSFFSGDITIFNSFRVEMGSLLSSFGKLRTAQGLADIGVEASWFEIEKTSNEVVAKIYQIYEGVLLARELQKLTHDAEKAINDKIDSLHNAKVVDQLSILKLKLTLYEIEKQDQEAKGKENLALSALKFQMGLNRDVDFDIKDKDLEAVLYPEKPLDYYFDEARDHLPEFKLLEMGIRAKEKQLILEKLAPAPNLGIGGFFEIGRAPGVTGTEFVNTYTDPFNYTRAAIGFQLKGEFDYHKTKAKVEEAQADLLKTIYNKRAAVGGLKLDIERCYQDVEDSRKIMTDVEEEKKSAQQMVFLTKSNLDLGVGEEKEYADALQAFLAFRAKTLEAIYNYNVAVSSLKIKIGQLYQDGGKESL